MKITKVIFLVFAVLGLMVGGAMAADVGKGKALFNDTTLGTSGKSCNSCHPNGKGLEASGAKSKFKIMGKTQNSLEEAVNFCIKMALKGKPIDPKGKDMANIVAYIKSLKGKKAVKKRRRRRKPIEGC